MNIFKSLFRIKADSANQAKERLKIIVAHQRLGRLNHDFLPLMEKDILEVIRKYVSINDNNIMINLDRNEDYSVLEVNVQLPDVT